MKKVVLSLGLGLTSSSMAQAVNDLPMPKCLTDDKVNHREKRKRKQRIKELGRRQKRLDKLNNLI